MEETLGSFISPWSLRGFQIPVLEAAQRLAAVSFSVPRTHQKRDFGHQLPRPHLSALTAALFHHFGELIPALVLQSILRIP